MDRNSYLSRSSGGILQARQGNRPRKFEISIYGPPQTSNNDSVILVGSISQLGNWIVERGVKAIWQEGKTWKAEIDLPFSVTTFEYKFVVLNNNTRAVVWEQGNNKVWSGIDKVVVAEHWEEDKTAMRNLGKMDLVVALSALRKVQLKETDELKAVHERELRMKHDVIEGLKRDVQQKSTELVNTKQELESALNRTIEEYEGRLKAMKLEYEAKLSEVQARQEEEQDEEAATTSKVAASNKNTKHSEPVLNSNKEQLKSASTKNDLQEIKVAADGLSTNASI
jgi:predicted Holliday junction resolvase-like endonuclease